MGWAFSVSLIKTNPSFTSTSQRRGRDQVFKLSGGFWPLWSVTAHFSHFTRRAPASRCLKGKISSNVPPNWTCGDVLSTAANAKRTDAVKTLLASPRHTASVFLPLRPQRSGKHWRRFNCTPHPLLSPLTPCVPQQLARLLSTGNIFHGKGSVTL